MGRWIALFSHTGQEIRDLSSILRRSPDVVMTDSMELQIKDAEGRILIAGNHRALMSHLRSTMQDEDMITLHGYMGIIPPGVIQAAEIRGAEILNGHPALVHMYPELKGKDPMDRIVEDYDKYENIGGVIHKVTSDVDSGLIVRSCVLPRPDLKDLEAATRGAMLSMWTDILEEKLC